MTIKHRDQTLDRHFALSEVSQILFRATELHRETVFYKELMTYSQAFGALRDRILQHDAEHQQCKHSHEQTL